MSQKNDFKAFSISDNANVIVQKRYEEYERLQEGFLPDDIPTHVLNKVLRQSSTISSVVADFIATQSGENVLDDGDLTKLTSQLNRALKQITREEVDRLVKTTNNIPVGAPIPWPLANPPIGYLTCNGSVFSKSQYPKLGEAYPDGKLPDLRGEFIRGWDDGRGVDNGRKLLSWQESSTIASFAGLYTDKIAHALTDTDGTAYHVKDYYQYRAPEKAQSVSVEMDYSRIRPRNIAFNYIVKAA
ncbi:tail fiber protein [Photorhabdus hainanensis]|uniref:tail fiber protein n=1 Tax=Photorhabdus hainanensis TaxID=1004166 RepID=UPI001BD397CC|nr:tail fiber protein [Photorhabdus hainanensis]MBS9432063.1 tail fiber protein [Photorhabdus hainanensis]